MVDTNNLGAKEPALCAEDMCVSLPVPWPNAPSEPASSIDEACPRSVLH